MAKLTAIVLGAGFVLATGSVLADTTVSSPQPRYQVDDQGRIYVGYEAGADSGNSVVTGASDVEKDGRTATGEWHPDTGWTGASDVVPEKQVEVKTPDVNDVSGRS